MAWIAARDVALLTLLYGAGLRISEALALQAAAMRRFGDWLTMLGKRHKERAMPVLPVMREAIARYMRTGAVCGRARRRRCSSRAAASR